MDDMALRLDTGQVLHVVPHAKDILHMACHQNQTGLGKKSGQIQKAIVIFHLLCYKPKTKKSFISAPGLARAIQSVFLASIFKSYLYWCQFSSIFLRI